MKKLSLVNILLNEQAPKIDLNLFNHHTKSVEIPTGMKSTKMRLIDPVKKKFGGSETKYVPMYPIAYIAELLRSQILKTLSNKIFKDPKETYFISSSQARNLREIAKELDIFVEDLKQTYPDQFER